MATTLARRTDELLEWTRNRDVQRLTKEILALQREAGGQVVEAMVQMGQRMRQIQSTLGHGQWLSWIQTAVPFSPRTITNAMRLSEWAQAEPRELARLRHLGPAKLYLLAPLAPERRRRITGRVPVVIPGHEKPKTIEVMTVIDLTKVIGSLAARPSPPKPIGKLVQGLRHRIAGVDAIADELVRRKDEVDEAQATELLDALQTVLDELHAAFDA
ncbi:DUF3102 domain-containing protein [Paraliomyxa miuraensis]|uniref:DUF3102 domain-containing protein n=1 Tax=Paraliomyxa miuraensis TaxID=376150 RepID=UPI00224CB63E|nr:DUF3102 domain-containing protein [Paraliomyxa miuraensis]MCX4243131.1 DUF3102 domain-containing protein [Paraliomyxa miuraensis]